MTLEQAFECPRTLSKLRSGPLGGLLEGFCDSLLESGFRRGTVRKHMVNVSHLNAYLMSRKGVTGQSLSSQDVSDFLRDYPSMARNRGPLDRHIAGVKTAISRLLKYLCASGHHFETLVEAAIYQPLLESYRKWLQEHQHAAPGTIGLRAHNLAQFLQWLGPMATPQGCAELTPEMVERFFLTYAGHAGRGSRRSMQAALRTFFRFCLQQGYIQQPLDRAVPTLRAYKLTSVPRGLSNEQALKLLQCIDRRSHAGRRDYAICQLLYTYGIRGGQVGALRLEDIDWATDRIVFRALKHGKDTCLPLTRAVGESLLDYLQNSRPDSQVPQLFMTLRAPYRPLQCNSLLSNRIASHLQAANIKIECQGTHVFRHGFATRMLAQGHSLKAIADVLGHRQLGSTLIYTKVDFEHLKQVALPWPGEISP